MELLHAAQNAQDLESYERAVLEHFDRAIGYEVALFVRGTPGIVRPGFDPNIIPTYVERMPVYAEELQGFIASALTRGRGVEVDTEFFRREELERTAYYDEVMRPQHGRSTLIGVLTFAAKPLG